MNNQIKQNLPPPNFKQVKPGNQDRQTFTPQAFPNQQQQEQQQQAPKIQFQTIANQPGKLQQNLKEQQNEQLKNDGVYSLNEAVRSYNQRRENIQAFYEKQKL